MQNNSQNDNFVLLTDQNITKKFLGSVKVVDSTETGVSKRIMLKKK
jgi:hypothetical protein